MCEQHTSCDSVAEGGDILEEASFHVGELSSGFESAIVLFCDLFRGG